MGALPCDNGTFGSHQYVWNCNDSVGHGSLIIIQSTGQTNCVCEG
jgi:hypothetical protein